MWNGAERVLAIGMVLGALEFLSPGPLFGQAFVNSSNTDIPILMALPIPCAGEVAVLEGNLHVVTHLAIDAAGGMHVEVNVNPEGVSGVGLTTGKKYQGTGVTRYDFNTTGPPPFEFVYVDNFLVVGQGPDNNLRVHFNTVLSIDASGNATVRVSNFTLECK